jgi:dolichyl-phosphate beta-glucosyltransferase
MVKKTQEGMIDARGYSEGSNKSISIIIPMYNEEKRVSKTIEKIVQYMQEKGNEYEILTVDDGSTDNTLEVVGKLVEQNDNIRLLKNPGNKGKGYSVKHGMLKAKKDCVLFSDADLSTPIEELEKMIPELQAFDVVIGSRKTEGSDIQVKQPFYRTLAGKIFPIVVNIILLPNIKDTQCGFKLFTKKAAQEVFNLQTIDGFSFDAEILFIANKKKYNIKEVPVIWINDADSKVRIIRDSMRMFKELLKIRWNNFRGKYKDKEQNKQITEEKTKNNEETA